MLLSGIDLVEISRIENSLNNERFLRRIMGESELEEYYTDGCKSQRVAACFAAKEAFAKAIGTGIGPFPLTDIQLLHEDSGKPYFFLTGKANEIVKNNSIILSVSATHTKEYAAALVIGHTEKEGLSL